MSLACRRSSVVAASARSSSSRTRAASSAAAASVKVMTAISSTVARPVAEHVDDAADERGRLAGAGAGLDAEVRVESRADPLARGLRRLGTNVLTRLLHLGERDHAARRRACAPRCARGRRRRAREVAEAARVSPGSGWKSPLAMPPTIRVEDAVEVVAAIAQVGCRAKEIRFNPPRRETLWNAAVALRDVAARGACAREQVERQLQRLAAVELAVLALRAAPLL